MGERTRAARAAIGSVPRQHLALAVLVVAQAGWLVAWSARGWYVNDDFSFLAEAVHHPLTWGYLTADSGGHLFPGFRLLFWLVARGTHLHYQATVVLRVILQAAATALLFRLVIALTRSWRGALVIAAVYAISPVILPGALYVSSALNLLPAQVCVLVAYLGVVRHAQTGSRWASLEAGLGLVAAALFWEKTAADSAPVLALLMVGWLAEGGVRQRAPAVVRDWLAWVLTFGPLLAFGAYYLTHHYGASAHGIPLHVIPRLAWDQWAQALWPSIIGGPWKWFTLPSVYVGIGSASTLVTVLGQVGFGVLLVLGWRRHGRRSLLAWIPLVVSVFVGVTIVGLGRYALLNAATAVDYHYVFDLAIPAAVAVALVVSPRAEPEQTATLEPAPDTSRRFPKVRIGVAALAACALVTSSVISAARWTQRWHESPAHSYVNNLISAVRDHPTPPAIYDTELPAGLVAPLDPYRNLSDLAAVARLNVTFDGGASSLDLVSETGRLVPASFETAATAVARAKPVCPTLISGVQSVTLPFSTTLPADNYFLRLEYFQTTVGEVSVGVTTASGRSIAVTGGSDVQLNQPIGQQIFKLANGAPASVTIAGTTAATNVCADLVTVGLPVATQP